MKQVYNKHLKNSYKTTILFATNSEMTTTDLFLEVLTANEQNRITNSIKYIRKRISKKILLLGFIYFGLISLLYGQDYCNTSRFDTTDIFADSQLDTLSIVYGQNKNWLGSTQNLHMFLTFPDSINDSFIKRPFILLIHGGGLFKGNRYECKDEATYYSKKGFVVASLEYRLGWQLGNGNYPTLCNGNNQSHIEALYRAVQDTKAALRFMVANSSTYRIDTSYFFIGGSSAGAFTSIATQFISQTDFAKLNPTIRNTLGSLDSSSNALTVPFSIKGILCSKGAILDTSMITPSNVVPIIFFHGTKDSFYPYLTNHAYSCQNYFLIQGSGLMASRLKHLDECYELNYRNGYDHNLYVGNYTMSRKAEFMKRILCSDCRQIVVEDSIMITDSQINNLQVLNIDLTLSYSSKKGKLKVGYPTDLQLKLEITDKLNKLVYQSAFLNKTVINISALPNGIYNVWLKQGTKSIIRKFVKE